jgi:hypothetical protein
MYVKYTTDNAECPKQYKYKEWTFVKMFRESQRRFMLIDGLEVHWIFPGLSSTVNPLGTKC